MTGAFPGAPDRAVLTALLPDQPRRTIRRGASLYHEGDVVADAHYIHDGLVKLVMTAHGGFQALFAIRGAGEFVGEHSAIDGLPRQTSAVAMTDISVSSVHRDVLIQLVSEHSDLAMELLVVFGGHLRAATSHTLDLSSGDATSLVARRLHQLAFEARFEALRRVHHGRTIIEMPISQHELASWAGVSPRSVTGALRRLREDGVITTRRLQIEVHDPSGLEARSTPGAVRA